MAAAAVPELTVIARPGCHCAPRFGSACAARNEGRCSGCALAAQCDPPQSAWQAAFLESAQVEQGEPGGEPVDEGPVEEVDDEPAVLEHVVAVAGACAVVRIAGVPDGVDVQSCR